jgi:hypothetical protein
MLDRVHQEFSAEELASVKLALLNEESDSIKANAGRQRLRNLEGSKQQEEFAEQGTIACVSGFLFNMVERSVKLISPCNANERWPLGYIVYDQGNFSDARELKFLLERMIADNMSLSLRPDDYVKFRHDLSYKTLPNGFQLSTKFKSFKFCDDVHFEKLGEVIHRGNKTAREIISLFKNHGTSPSITNYNLSLLFERGLLDSEPF